MSMRSTIASPPRRSLRAQRGSWNSQWSCALCQRRWMTTDGHFEAGDTVLLRRTTKQSSTGLLLWPLQAAKKTYLKEGVLEHDNIIGKRVRDIVTSHKGTRFLVHNPTLEEYVHLTPRTCTPIYAADANLIVSLLDIHIDGACNHEPLSYAILEAGTGHGSLTLHLARAIHSANTPSVSQPRSHETEPSSITDQQEQGRRSVSQAIVHTVDNSRKRSKHAQKIVKGFRGGLYRDNVEFHCSDLEEFLKKPAVDTSASPSRAVMYNHIILDLPNSHFHMPLAALRLKVNGCLLLWVPSITQLLDATNIVRKEGLPLHLDRVVEVGQGLSGGRLWDVRPTRIRHFDRNAEGVQAVDGEQADPEEAMDESQSSEASEDGHSDIQMDDATLTRTHPRDGGEAIVCRPKVGERTVGGGFIGLWRRIREEEQES